MCITFCVRLITVHPAHSAVHCCGRHVFGRTASDSAVVRALKPYNRRSIKNALAICIGIKGENMAKTARKSGGSSSGGGSSLLAGLLIGLMVGVAVAVGVVLYLNKGNTPFTSKTTPPPDALPTARPKSPSEPEILRPNNGKRRDQPSQPASQPASEGERYDFYKMLQGNEKPEVRATPSPRPQVASQAAQRTGAFLQVGAFQREEDADNLKAKLALLGIEARIHTTEIPEKGLWHRVRVGPFNGAAELDRMRDTLKQNGIDSAVVKGN
jgi:cell division protein FtsN